MRVLVAPASFKESVTAVQAARAMADGVRRAGALPIELPLADGGRGTLECLAGPMGLDIHRAGVTGPMGEPVQAAFGYATAARTAVIEMASASGLALVPTDRRNPLLATTRGTGELVRAALDLGAERLFLGIGDSATCDGGCGMAQALGVRLLDGRGRDIGVGAAGLETVVRIDPTGRHPRLGEIDLCVACDVDNPLLGERGSARVFGPQKGAEPADVERIEAALARLADVIERELGIDVRSMRGGGAAGGLGAGAVALLGARLVPGAQWVMAALDIDRCLAQADLVLTGEGRFDGQSLGGKATLAIARRARAAAIPCVVIPGSLGDGWQPALREGVTAIFPLAGENVTLHDALSRAAELLADRAEQATRAAVARRTCRENLGTG